MKKYFLLHANCIPVKGIKRSIICDISLERYRYIPNNLYEILMDTHIYNIEELKNKYKFLSKGITNFFNLLQDEDYGHFIEDKSLFPKLNLDYKTPYLIQNAIIDIDNFHSFKYFEKFIKNLDSLYCEAVQVRIYTTISLNDFKFIQRILENSSIQYSEIIFKYSKYFENNDFINLLSNGSTIRSVIIYNSPKTKMSYFTENKVGQIYYLLKNISDESHCGLVNKQIFNISIRSFTESKNFNSCLNRKISLDKQGNIKNCPSMQESFGNIKDTTLAEALEKPGFKKYWNIKKDDITKCKDCEFRYICTDCRAYILNPLDIYSPPIKCRYNPYIAKWE